MYFPERKEIRLKEYDYSANGAYFVTVCTKDKKHLFWDKEKMRLKKKNRVGADNIRPEDIDLSRTGEIVKEAIENIPIKYENVKLDSFVIMPNHIHIIIFIENPGSGRMISAPTRSVVIGQMKRYASKTAGFGIWQKSFYDHIIRNYRDYEEKQNYILSNPGKWVEDEYYSQ
ncbi:MAG: hypothetical protein IKY30_07765 [Oscillospiraceae bacterium]|nr:hypothetical protein [Oscillospiraceae bacterium]